MKYLPISESEIESRLSSLGLKNLKELFRSIPEDVKKRTASEVPEPFSEIELRRHYTKDLPPAPEADFMGANGHFHYIPSVIDPLVSRGEFLTAYTPYQPEISQGTLQAMFEYQSMMADLMGTEVSNASLYDGSTALAESALMAVRITKKTKILVSDMIHPEYIETLEQYTTGNSFEYEMTGTDEKGRTILPGDLSGDIAAVMIQSPNYAGVIEDIRSVKSSLPENVLLIVCITEALSMGLLKSAGSAGADIVCGEAQSFGVPLLFGGPWLGFMGTATKYMRNLPGRLIGQGKDINGDRAFVVTLAAREQHIRRQKATSNICTNQGLMALRAAVYLSVMGKHGVKRAAERSAKFCHYGRRKLLEQTNIKVLYNDSPVFNEFMIETPVAAETVFNRCMESARIAPGTIAGENRLIAAFNETMSPEVVDRWAGALVSACK